ncbi:MAG TPA: hypothetical protein VFT45_26610 [Longimicrobium sp.]|nr:hypothetical protein [Longimicrobium sp.]
MFGTADWRKGEFAPLACAPKPKAKDAREARARTALASNPGPPIREGGFRVVVAANSFALAGLHDIPQAYGTIPDQILDRAHSPLRGCTTSAPAAGSGVNDPHPRRFFAV